MIKTKMRKRNKVIRILADNPDSLKNRMRAISQQKTIQ
jgi:predicted signal transduction protein with EAL and GGDEF domain